MEGKLIYLDPSAILKLVVEAPQTEPLRDELSRWPERVTSRLSVVEVMREVRRVSGAENVARKVLEGLALVNVDEDVLSLAAELDVSDLRLSDTLHIATALSLGDDLGAVVSYDGGMLSAADAVSLNLLAPGASPSVRPSRG